MLFDDPALHASAEEVGDGRVWLLLTSALEPQGPYPLLQLAGAAALAAVLIARAGARVWCRAALAGHVLSAVVVYGLMGLVGAGAAAAQPDYGISCVVGGTVGGLLVTARGSRLALAAGVLGAVALIPGTRGWYGLEHPLSIVFGAAAAWPLARA
jgi:hypothetical protein